MCLLEMIRDWLDVRLAKSVKEDEDMEWCTLEELEEELGRDVRGDKASTNPDEIKQEEP